MPRPLTDSAVGATTGVRWPVGRWQISPDSQRLATGGSDGTVRIRDAAPGQARALTRVDNIIFARAEGSNPSTTFSLRGPQASNALIIDITARQAPIESAVEESRFWSYSYV